MNFFRSITHNTYKLVELCRVSIIKRHYFCLITLTMASRTNIITLAFDILQ